jgi:phage gp37-like protein
LSQYALGRTSGAVPQVNSAIPNALVNLEGQRTGRKSGGRVGSHDAEADRLVMAAERAKRGLSAHTEGLLNTSDDSVASALEIANRSI